LKRVLLIDNYDSFVGSLYQYLGMLGVEPVPCRNDRISAAQALEGGFTHLVLSPGPRTPVDAGVSVELVRVFAGRIPVLGVCLGHQCIGRAFGARLARAMRLVHGKTSNVHHDGRGVFSGRSSPFLAARYHSLALERRSLPSSLEVSAWTDDGEVMGIRHRGFPDGWLEGVQFHPESFLTEDGLRLIAAFLEGAG
jgi:anthranilate synthase/aminodeoxychorismate synthase-like glutamine amidotransferase